MATDEYGRLVITSVSRGNPALRCVIRKTPYCVDKRETEVFGNFLFADGSRFIFADGAEFKYPN